jgi:hypothetical protein
MLLEFLIARLLQLGTQRFAIKGGNEELCGSVVPFGTFVIVGNMPQRVRCVHSAFGTGLHPVSVMRADVVFQTLTVSPRAQLASKMLCGSANVDPFPAP